MTILPDILATQSLLAARQLSPLDLVENCLKQIERFESQVRAWVLVDAQGARRAARHCADQIARGNIRGPLHGIPLGIKDIVDVEGWPTRAGSPITPDRAAARDAPLVSRLRDAGAILLGKTVTTQFASFDPPPTRNPWNLARTPGGSSSGSAAAVAMGMCLGAIGSQTGGSITRPASYCGVAGCKPTYGLVSLEGIVPLSFHMDHPGPIARRVADLAILLEAIADPAVPGGVKVPAYSRQLEAGHPPRLGTLDGFFTERANAPIRKAFQAALDSLRAAGAPVATRPLPWGFDRVIEFHRRIMAVEAAEVHRNAFPARADQFGPQLARLLREGLATPIQDYVAALRHQQEFRRRVVELFTNVDALILPATTSTAPDAATTGDPAFNSPWSYSALPVVSVPCGLADDGMPVAVQLIAAPLAESTLLASACWCERVFQFDAQPPLIDES